ncbi:MAG: XRE family transcriptional regulator [Schwartzia succinivorans]|nr:XRE family transcriptional regulator [Schwartzia succinivorans]
MAGKEEMLSKAEIDEYIRLHYKPEKKLGKSFLGILKGTGACLGGAIYTGAQRPLGLEDLLDSVRNKIELTFSEKLMELIKEKGRKPTDIYKKADINKDLFSKIKANKYYRPTKETALAFAIALHLNLKETADLIGRAGYALSSSIKSDLIVQCYIEAKVYNIMSVNDSLVEYGFKPLTGRRFG